MIDSSNCMGNHCYFQNITIFMTFSFDEGPCYLNPISSNRVFAKVPLQLYGPGSGYTVFFISLELFLHRLGPTLDSPICMATQSDQYKIPLTLAWPLYLRFLLNYAIFVDNAETYGQTIKLCTDNAGMLSYIYLFLSHLT